MQQIDIIGFTGTRDGLTTEQNRALWLWFRSIRWRQFHHGMCVGADETAANFAYHLSICGRLVVAHPGNNREYWSELGRLISNPVHEPIPNMERNRRIVGICNVLLACPKDGETVRSGTWSTVRYARKTGKPVILFMPDGSITHESPTATT